MPALADLQRRTGVGAGAILVYLVLVAGGVAIAYHLGTVDPLPGRGTRFTIWIPALIYAFGLLGVASALGNAGTYLRLTVRGETATGDLASGGSAGTVATRGAVREAEGTLATPFAERPAVAYTVRVLRNDEDDARAARESEKNWRVVHVGEDATAFALDDGSGQIRVHPEDARLVLEDRTEHLVLESEPIPDHAVDYLRGEGEPADGDTHVRFEECALEPGEAALVAGTCEDGRIDASLVGEGDHEARLRRRVVSGGTMGAIGALLGFAGMLFGTGAI